MTVQETQSTAGGECRVKVQPSSLFILSECSDPGLSMTAYPIVEGTLATFHPFGTARAPKRKARIVVPRSGLLSFAEDATLDV